MLRLPAIFPTRVPEFLHQTFYPPGRMWEVFTLEDLKKDTRGMM